MAKSWKLTLDTGRVKAAARDGAARGMFNATEHGLAEARKRVPHEEGTLERSGRASVDSTTLRGAVSFDTEYAVRQHEDLSLRHDDGRQAKYLENALTTNRAEFLRIIGDAIRGSLG